MARFSGRYGPQPICPRILPTWLKWYSTPNSFLINSATRAGPKIIGEACGLGPFEDLLLQDFQIAFLEFRGRSRSRVRVNSLGSAFL